MVVRRREARVVHVRRSAAARPTSPARAPSARRRSPRPPRVRATTASAKPHDSERSANSSALTHWIPRYGRTGGDPRLEHGEHEARVARIAGQPRGLRQRREEPVATQLPGQARVAGVATARGSRAWGRTRAEPPGRRRRCGSTATRADPARRRRSARTTRSRPASDRVGRRDRARGLAGIRTLERGALLRGRHAGRRPGHERPGRLDQRGAETGGRARQRRDRKPGAARQAAQREPLLDSPGQLGRRHRAQALQLPGKRTLPPANGPWSRAADGSGTMAWGKSPVLRRGGTSGENDRSETNLMIGHSRI